MIQIANNIYNNSKTECGNFIEYSDCEYKYEIGQELNFKPGVLVIIDKRVLFMNKKGYGVHWLNSDVIFTITETAIDSGERWGCG